MGRRILYAVLIIIIFSIILISYFSTSNAGGGNGTGEEKPQPTTPGKNSFLPPRLRSWSVYYVDYMDIPREEIVRVNSTSYCV